MRKPDISDGDRLLYIQDALQFILLHTNIAETDFYKDEVLKRAVVRDLEVIGEAANYLSKALKMRFYKVPWQQIIATRHRIIHEYFDVNYQTVWAIIKNDLPILKEAIQHILAEIK